MTSFFEHFGGVYDLEVVHQYLDILFPNSPTVLGLRTWLLNVVSCLTYSLIESVSVASALPHLFTEGQVLV